VTVEQRFFARKGPSIKSREGSAAQVEMSELEPPNRDNQLSLHDNPPLNSPDIAPDIEQDGSFQERFILYGVPKEKKQLHNLAALRSAPDDYYDNPVMARRTAKAAGGIWVFHACLYTYAGLAWDFAEVEDSVVVLLVLWRSFQILLSIKRIVNMMYFVKAETKLRIRRKDRSTSGSQQQLVVACQSPAGTSVASTQPSTT
jgi:ribosomal protein L37AE/L43A